MLKSPGCPSYDENTIYYGRPVLDPFQSVRYVVGAVSLGLQLGWARFRAFTIFKIENLLSPATD